jgi:microcystin-dependent protein
LFNLPNIQGRTIVGKTTSAGTFASLNSPGGQETVTLDLSSIPLHTHTTTSGTVTGVIQFKGDSNTTSQHDGHKHDVKDEGHSHTFGGYSNNQAEVGDWNQEYAADDSWQNGQSTGGATAKIQESTAGAHSHTVTPTGDISWNLTAPGKTTSVAGGGLPHNNLQPYIVLNYFIKVTKESARYTAAPLVSDIRVKCNIHSLNSEEAIEAIRMLQPKRYEYIDRTISDFTRHVGFIAQEAKMCIPESVRTKKEFIPNIYSMAKLTTLSGSMILTSVQHTITTMIQDELLEQNHEEVSIKHVKLKMFNRSKECFYVCCIESIDDYNIMVQPSDDVSQSTHLVNGDYFVYGQEIDDYHCMNNDAIFSTLVSAFQALDQKCKQQEETLFTQKYMLQTQQLLLTTLIEKNSLKI